MENSPEQSPDCRTLQEPNTNYLDCEVPNDGPMAELNEVARVVSTTGGTVNINYNPHFVDQRQFHTHQTILQDCSQPLVAGGDVVVQSSQQTAPLNLVDNEQQTTAFSSPASQDLENAMEAVRNVQRKYNKDVFVFSQMNKDKNIPTVYPKITEAPFLTRVKKASSSEIFQAPPEVGKPESVDKDVKFNDLVDRVKRHSFTGLVGHPGAGKTTLCFRLQKKCSDILCILVMFMNLNFAINQKLTLRQLILDNVYPELSKNDCELAFKWILDNEDKCVLILDGYDQAEWCIEDKFPLISYNEPQTVCELISNICSKKYLPRAHVVFTSRPHSMTSIPKSVKLDHMFLIQDFAFEDMKKLFFAFAEDDAATIWDRLHALAPQLVTSCLNPLMLQLIIQVCTSLIANIGDITTMTRVFAAVLDDFSVSEHTRHEDLESIISQLAKLAYNATKRSVVVLTPEDLRDVGLSANIAQDLVITQHSQKRGCFNKVFKGDPHIYFSHQTLQEYLTALYAKHQMSLKDFKQLVKRDLFTPQWSVIRRFLFGLLLDSNQDLPLPIQENTPSTFSKIRRKISFKRSVSTEIASKMKIAKTSIFQRMMAVSGVMQTEEWLVDRLVFPLREDERNLIDLCIDIRESNDDDVTIKAAQLFPTKVDLSYIPLTCSDAHALSNVLMRVTKPVEMLRLPWCHLDSKSFAHITNSIKSMNLSISFLDIRSNYLQDTDIETILSILPNVNDELWIGNCFKQGDRRRNVNQQERKKLQYQLNAMQKNLKIVISQRDVLERIQLEVGI